MLKQDNPEKFEEITKKLNIKKIINDNKEHFPDNEMKIDRIVVNKNMHHIDLYDKYCPIKQGTHAKQSLYCEINRFRQFVLKCYAAECRGKEFPVNDIITVNNNNINSLFTVNNYNITIGDDQNDINFEKIIIDQDAVIFQDLTLNKLMLESLNATDVKLAIVVCHLCKNKFNYTTTDKGEYWYEFIDHRWQRSERLPLFIMDELPTYYKTIITYVNNSNISKNDKTMTVKEIKKIYKKLESNTSINNIINVCVSRMKNVKFYETLDTKPYLFSFTNGVYDLTKMEFREGKPEDMISLTCGYDYVPTYSKHKQELLNFLIDILPEQSDRDYLLTYLSSALTGLNSTELFTILTGEGRNGKSKFNDLVQITFGDDYYGTGKQNMMSCKRADENAPEPALVYLRTKRVVFTSEPEKRVN